MPSDHDIDISIWWDSSLDYDGLKKELEAAGYRVLRDYYQGELFRYWLEPLPKASENARGVDMRFFRMWNGSMAWSPRTQRRDYFDKFPPGLQVRARNAIRSTWLFWNYKLGGRAPKMAWPLLEYLTFTHCWWIPAHFFQHIITLEGGWRVPRDYEEYLNHRYGDWRVPVPDWQFKVDDPTYKKIRPEKLFQMAANGATDDS